MIKYIILGFLLCFKAEPYLGKIAFGYGKLRNIPPFIQYFHEGTTSLGTEVPVTVPLKFGKKPKFLDVTILGAGGYGLVSDKYGIAFNLNHDDCSYTGAPSWSPSNPANPVNTGEGSCTFFNGVVVSGGYSGRMYTGTYTVSSLPIYVHLGNPSISNAKYTNVQIHSGPSYPTISHGSTYIKIGTSISLEALEAPIIPLSSSLPKNYTYSSYGNTSPFYQNRSLLSLSDISTSKPPINGGRTAVLDLPSGYASDLYSSLSDIAWFYSPIGGNSLNSYLEGGRQNIDFRETFCKTITVGSISHNVCNGDGQSVDMQGVTFSFAGGTMNRKYDYEDSSKITLIPAGAGAVKLTWRWQ